MSQAEHGIKEVWTALGRQAADIQIGHKHRVGGSSPCRRRLL
jgi:hypothetical protein